MAGKLSDTDLKGLIAQAISTAEADASGLNERRERALAYYQGELPDVATEHGRSTVVSTDFADSMAWMLPGIMRVFASTEQVALVEPVEPGDEEAAKQAGELLSYVFWKENGGYEIFRAGTWDALAHGNAVVKSWWDDTPQYRKTRHTGLTADQLEELLSPDEEGVEPEVIASTEREQLIDLPTDPVTGAEAQQVAVPVYDVEIKRVVNAGCVVIEVIPPEDYLHDDNGRFDAHRASKTRSELIEMGFDREQVDGLTQQSGENNGVEQKRDPHESGDYGDKSTDLVDLYECFMRVDVDGDGIAELVRAYWGGNSGAGDLLSWEEWEDDEDGAPFDDIPCDPMPHRWEARSLFDKTESIQKVKSVLKRNALDNTYATNNPQRFVKGKILNPEELFSPSFGGAIMGDPQSSVENLSVAYVADKAYAAMEYEDATMQRRTGVGAQTMALDPDALQQQTATASQIAHDAGYSHVELIARDMAELGWQKVFRRVLRLLIKHQDRPKVIRLRGKFVEIDPRPWNADMDVTIDVGLGTGSRDRDIAMLQSILGNQIALTDRLASSGFGDKALEMLPYIRTTLVKQAEAAGVRSPDSFYPEVQSQDIELGKQRIAQMQGQTPVPLQIAQIKAQSDQAVQQSEAELNRVRAAAEIQKAQFDAQVKQLEARAAAQRADMESQLAAAQLQIKQLEIQARSDTDMRKAELDALTRIEVADIAAKTAAGQSILEAELEARLGLQNHSLQMQRDAMRPPPQQNQGPTNG